MNNIQIDLRSDTLTKPTKEMLEAMLDANVGDDVYGEDPTVIELQNKVANMLGMEDALICPSGTMSNQIGVAVNTKPQDEVICHKLSHIHLYEGGGMSYLSMVSPKLLEGERGQITAKQVQACINPMDVHLPRTSMVILENTMNKGGGSVYAFEEMKAISKVCRANGLKLHLDGARLFNAIVASGDLIHNYGDIFDTISICFSKGLGAPIGSVLVGTSNTIDLAKRKRKVMGGGMRQVGYLASACLYALENHVSRLVDDHRRAKEIRDILLEQLFVEYTYPVETNIVIAKLAPPFTETWFVDQLQTYGIKAVCFGEFLVRFVTHLDINDQHIELFREKIKALSNAQKSLIVN